MLLAAIWADILLVSRIRAEFGPELSLRLIFERPTVAALAERIFELQAQSLDESQFETLLAEIEETHV